MVKGKVLVLVLFGLPFRLGRFRVRVRLGLVLVLGLGLDLG